MVKLYVVDLNFNLENYTICTSRRVGMWCKQRYVCDQCIEVLDCVEVTFCIVFLALHNFEHSDF